MQIQFPNEESRWTYLAGIIDTEGCIGLTKVRGKTRKKKLTRDFFVPYIIISSTNKEFIDFLVSDFGGGFHFKDKQSGWGFKPLWGWKVRANLMREILPMITPYLIIKRKQAEMVQEALEILKKGARAGSKSITPPTRLYELWKEIKGLNKRGGKGH